MKRILLAAALFSVAVSTSAFAQSLFETEVKARQGLMSIMRINMGMLNNMDRGLMEYDANQAQAMANAVLGISMVDFVSLFPEGSDNFEIETTKAADMIWENTEGFAAEWAKVQMTAPELAKAAGQGKDAMSAALAGIAGTCRSCHTTYRLR